MDDHKDQPIEGLTILTDLKPNGNNSWSGGQILDPENGRVYSVKMSLLEDGQKLNVRGYLDIDLLGCTQTWVCEQWSSADNDTFQRAVVPPPRG